MTKRIILSSLFLLGLIYILWPGPSSINDFSPLPNSLKSNEPGDTRQVPNVAAYFSQADRAQITEFYRTSFKKMYFLGLIPPISLNYPPETGKIYVRDQVLATFVEEYSYPLKNSIFVAGYEPYVENSLLKRTHGFLGDHIHINGQFFVSKTTLRFYPSPIWSRTIVYLGIWLGSIYLYRLYRKVLKDHD